MTKLFPIKEDDKKETVAKEMVKNTLKHTLGRTKVRSLSDISKSEDFEIDIVITYF